MTPTRFGLALAVLAFAGTPAAHAENTKSPDAAAPATSTPPATTATAVADDPAGAKLLFDEAVELANQGKYPEACAKLEQSQKLHDGLGTAFNLAGCWQKIGRTASAYALFETVVSRAHAAGQTEREDLARSRLEALAPKLSRVRIDLAERAPDTQVYRDDVPVPESDWGKAVPVDRGSHAVRVSAPGKKAWSANVDVSEPALTLAVAVPALADETPVAAAPAETEETEPNAESKPTEAKPSGSGARTRAIIVAGLGAGALTFGIIEGAQYIYSNNAAKGLCPSGVNCTDEEIAQHEKAVHDAKQARTWAFVGIGVGTATLALATYLFFSAPHASEPADQKRTALAVEPVVDGRGTYGAALHGSF